MPPWTRPPTYISTSTLLTYLPARPAPPTTTTTTPPPQTQTFSLTRCPLLPPCPTTQNKNVISVKGGCLEGLDWSRAIHIWTKSAMIPIPEGAESYSEESTRASGYGDSQEFLDQPGMLAGSGACDESEPESHDDKAGQKGESEKDKELEGLCSLAGPDMEAVLNGM